MTDTKSATTPAVMTASGTNVSGTQANLKKIANQTNKSQKSRPKPPTHPRTAEMVNAAIKTLKERGGSSLQAIKKYISATYKIDVEKQAPFIKKYLKTAVSNGSLVQPKGKGAAGSFKLSVGKTVANKIKKKPTTKAAPLKKVVTVVKKAVSKKSVKKVAVKKLPIKVTATEKRKVIKGPAAKPPKVKSAGKVKVAPKSPLKKKMAVKRATLKAKTRKQAAKKVTLRRK